MANVYFNVPIGANQYHVEIADSVLPLLTPGFAVQIKQSMYSIDSLRLVVKDELGNYAPEYHFQLRN